LIPSKCTFLKSFLGVVDLGPVWNAGETRENWRIQLPEERNDTTTFGIQELEPNFPRGKGRAPVLLEEGENAV
jgi:hypothetical protein